ncbi:hypothetical protein [Nonomuraea typhae]|uniref:Lipoprotein n=1 Tax=Nonomuraea typhae TaxID=2603600 RepID=A0ABW7Z8T8_9ACTN
MRKLLPVLAVCALAGCSSPEAGRQAAAPSPTPSTSAAATETPSPPRKPTTRVKDCFDGRCLLKVSRPITIQLDAKKFYYPTLEIVAIGADTITCWVEYPNGGGARSSAGEDGPFTFGVTGYPSVEVRPVSIENGQAVVSISPVKGE